MGDPMCSWCWAFHVHLVEVRVRLPDTPVRYVMGGLAPDTLEPMPAAQQRQIQGYWRTISERTGTEFNFDFWTECQPRRSTYPACRAVIAAEKQTPTQGGPAMFEAIQRAYYLEARNPSNDSTLVELAGEIELDTECFAADLRSDRVEELLLSDFALRRKLRVTGFPSLLLQNGDEHSWLTAGYGTSDEIVARLGALGVI